jgi:hypothetical protein
METTINSTEIQGKLNPLDLFFQTSSDASNLECSQQEELENRFSKWWEDYKIVYQRQIRSEVLLSIEGVKWEDNMLFTLKSLDNIDYSHSIDAKEILDCSREQFEKYLAEFKSTEKINWLFKKQTK